LDGLDFDFISNLRTDGDFDTSYGDMNMSGDWGNDPNNNVVNHIPGSGMGGGIAADSLHMAPNNSLFSDAPTSSMPPLHSSNTNVSGRTTRSAMAAATYQPKDMTGLLDESFDRSGSNRRGSIDALMNEALFDVDLPPNVIRNHVPGGMDVTTAVADLDMDSIFNQFASEADALGHSRTNTLDHLLGGTGNTGKTNSKKSIRLLGPGGVDLSSNSTDISPEKVDLSAYASHAMSLQQQNLERKLNSAAGPGMPSSPQKSMVSFFANFFSILDF
jgi:hypothetical protein